MAYEWDLERVLLRMDRGDSFFIPCLNTDDIRKKILHEAGKLGMKVSVRYVVEGELQGLRTWKV